MEIDEDDNIINFEEYAVKPYPNSMTFIKMFTPYLKMKEMVPLSKQSKKERRKYYASKRGSWNGVSPVTRVVQSRKIYDRKRMKSADRKICAE